MIGSHSFNNTKLKSVVIPNSVTNLAGDAFSYCKSLESVTVPGKLTNIHERAFVGCPKLLDANGKPRLTRVPDPKKTK